MTVKIRTVASLTGRKKEASDSEKYCRCLSRACTAGGLDEKREESKFNKRSLDTDGYGESVPPSADHDQDKQQHVYYYQLLDIHY